MKPFFISFGSIRITWFMFFSLISIVSGYIILKIKSKETNLDLKILEDGYFYLVLFSFIGSRAFYVILNFDLYKNDLFSIFRLNHNNLSFLGGVITGILIIFIFSRYKNIYFKKMFNVYVYSFYLAMGIGIWSIKFQNFNKSENLLLISSIIFLIGILIEELTKEYEGLTFIIFSVILISNIILL
ncbi:MAG: hypothetical protein FH751_03770 [Firmicutes bacterium]|nr:hypothetical protein [Bacillota bacterium]